MSKRTSFTVASIILAAAIAALIAYPIFNFYFHPASTYEVSDVIDGYIVDAVINGTQLYAHAPNDDTIYILTISVDDTTLWQCLTSSLRTKKEKYISVISKMVANEIETQKNENNKIPKISKDVNLEDDS